MVVCVFGRLCRRYVRHIAQWKPVSFAVAAVRHALESGIHRYDVQPVADAWVQLENDRLLTSVHWGMLKNIKENNLEQGLQACPVLSVNAHLTLCTLFVPAIIRRAGTLLKTSIHRC